MSLPIHIDYYRLFNELCHDLQIPSRTVEYCNKRINCEGIKFLTVTLPKLANGVLFGLDRGSLLCAKPDLTCFQWKGSALYHFDELTSEIFEKDGSAKLNIDPYAIWRIRQFSLYFFKLSLEFTEDQLAKSERAFKTTDSEVGTYDIDFVELMRKNLETYYKFPDHSEVLQRCRPRYGPGTFSETNKDSRPYWLKKVSVDFLNKFLPSCDGIKGFFKLIPSTKNVLEMLDGDTSDYSEVCFVPKDSRGPRVISREPLHNLKVQMSFFDYFSHFFENSSKSRINFTDQQINRNLAQIGSNDGSYATLDLKEASDRVSFDLVKQMSRHIPVLRYFLKFRSRVAKLPSGLKLKLNKLAGMGSGLTFIWLSVICHTAIATEISNKSGISFPEASKQVYVYGDDVVVKSCHVTYAFNALEKVGLTVNANKSFFRKRIGTYQCFRESCGGDFYKGTDVGIQRLKFTGCDIKIDRFAKRLTFGSSKAKVVALMNAHAAEMSLNGYNSVSALLYNELKRVCGKLPKARYPSSIVSHVTREFVSYPTDSTGMTSVFTAVCTTSKRIDGLDLHENWHYANALRPQVGTGFVLDKPLRPSASQFEMTVPRSFTLKRVKVSGYSLLG